MDPLNPPVSIVLALWAPSPSSRGLSLVEGPDGAHDVIGSVVTGSSDTPTAAADDDSGRVSLEQWLTSARPLSRVSAVLPSPEIIKVHDISYGVYIYHFPVLQLLILLGMHRHGLVLLLLMAGIITVILSTASWLGIERAAMRWSRGRRPWSDLRQQAR